MNLIYICFPKIGILRSIKTFLVTPSSNVSKYQNYPRKPRNGLEPDPYGEGWAFREESPINGQNIFRSDHPWNIGNSIPPFDSDGFENDLVYNEEGIANHVFNFE